MLRTFKDANVCSSVSGGSALCLLLLTTLQLCHLPPLLPPPSVTPRACSLDAGPSVLAVVLHYHTFKGSVLEDQKCFIFVFLMYYLCENYCKLIIIQYYIANCMSWVPRLTLLDLPTHSWNGPVHMGLTVVEF